MASSSESVQESCEAVTLCRLLCLQGIEGFEIEAEESAKGSKTMPLVSAVSKQLAAACYCLSGATSASATCERMSHVQAVA